MIFINMPPPRRWYSLHLPPPPPPPLIDDVLIYVAAPRLSFTATLPFSSTGWLMILLDDVPTIDYAFLFRHACLASTAAALSAASQPRPRIIFDDWWLSIADAMPMPYDDRHWWMIADYRLMSRLMPLFTIIGLDWWFSICLMIFLFHFSIFLFDWRYRWMEINGWMTTTTNNGIPTTSPSRRLPTRNIDDVSRCFQSMFPFSIDWLMMID